MDSLERSQPVLLVLERDADTRGRLRSVLEQAGYTVWATDHVESARLIRRELNGSLRGIILGSISGNVDRFLEDCLRRNPPPILVSVPEGCEQDYLALVQTVEDALSRRRLRASAGRSSAR